MIRRIGGWLLLVIGIAVCCAVAYGASVLASYSWGQVVSYESPYVSPPLEPAGPAAMTPLADRVILVIVDGMRDDITRTGMPSLDRLREYGTDAILLSEQPSLSYPNWTTILSGAPQSITGVTTNWWEGRVPVPTVIDSARAAGRSVVVVGPADFSELYGIEPGPQVVLREWPESGYLSETLVDDALRLTKQSNPQFLVLHLPDLDEAGHDHGSDSAQYRDVAARIDVDLGRLIGELQDDKTAFVIVSDHGHLATGGHGGWEPEVVRIPFIVAGVGSRLSGQATGSLDQVAPTVAVLGGFAPPAFSAGTALRAVVATDATSAFSAERAQQAAFAEREYRVISGRELDSTQQASPLASVQAVSSARDERLRTERTDRIPQALLLAGLGVLALVAVAFASWRAFVASIAGAGAYYAVYSALFFVVHRFRWSLSAFNTEDAVQAFFNLRMAEAAFSGLVAVAVAAFVYPLLRSHPKGPRVAGYRIGWLSLAPATILVVQVSLAMQVAWFVWAYGPDVTWTLPDFRWAFKFDLDLVQMTALGAAAVLGPLVSYVIGRYHPRVTSMEDHPQGPSSGRHSRRQAPAETPQVASSEGQPPYGIEGSS